MKKILFVIENLGGGGAERVLVNLVNNMNRTKFDVTVLTLFDKGVNAESLKSDVKHINLNGKKFRGIKLVYKFIPKKLLYRAYIKKYVEAGKYDLIVSYMTGVPAYVVSGSHLPKIAWIHGEYRKPESLSERLNIFGLRSIYNRFDCIVGVSEYVCGTVDNVINPGKKAITIYNTNDTERIYRLSQEYVGEEKNVAGTIISTVGCLEATKGYDRLINVCKKLSDEGFDFCLKILGEGIERKALEKKIDEYGLNDCVKLLGYCKNPYGIVKSSDLFVCSSRTEGLSTAVSEAVILGVPVVSTDVSGAKEILGENNEYGLVVENSEDGIYYGIKAMLTDEEMYRKYKSKVKERAAFFDTANTVGQAEELFEKIIYGGKH